MFSSVTIPPHYAPWSRALKLSTDNLDYHCPENHYCNVHLLQQTLLKRRSARRLYSQRPVDQTVSHNSACARARNDERKSSGPRRQETIFVHFLPRGFIVKPAIATSRVGERSVNKAESACLGSTPHLQ